MLFKRFLKSLNQLPVERSLSHKRILIAKTTHVGDVVITLPLAGILKYYYPESQILFLAKGSGCDIARRYAFIDEVYDDSILQTEEGLANCRVDIFIQVNNSKKLAKAAAKAEIPVRIGSIYRWHNWFLCTHCVFISRENTLLNKRQLDLQYLKPLGIKHAFSYKDLSFLYQFKPKPLTKYQAQIMDPHKFKLILHPSLITAKKYQWPLAYFKELVEALDTTRFQIFITGIESDRPYLEKFLTEVQGKVVDVVGKMNMDDFITFIWHCNGLVAGSTGPLHLAAALGIHALGIYRADHTYIKRWEAVGWRAEVVAQQAKCIKCPTGDPCQCILSIKPEYVKARVFNWLKII